MQILVDADGCPVKPEIFRVAKRCALDVRVVANSWMHVPDDPRVVLEVVSDGFDAADDRIVERTGPSDIVVTSDIPLAARCLAKGSIVLDPKGRRFTDADIGSALAARALHAHLRETGVMTGGPAPFQDRDRSKFLQALDTAVQEARRRRP